MCVHPPPFPFFHGLGGRHLVHAREVLSRHTAVSPRGISRRFQKPVGQFARLHLLQRRRFLSNRSATIVMTWSSMLQAPETMSQSMAFLGMASPPSTPATRRPGTTAGLSRSGSSYGALSHVGMARTSSYDSLAVRSAARSALLDSSRFTTPPDIHARHMSKEPNWTFVAHTRGTLKNQSDTGNFGASECSNNSRASHQPCKAAPPDMYQTCGPWLPAIACVAIPAGQIGPGSRKGRGPTFSHRYYGDDIDPAHASVRPQGSLSRASSSSSLLSGSSQTMRAHRLSSRQEARSHRLLQLSTLARPHSVAQQQRLPMMQDA